MGKASDSSFPSPTIFSRMLLLLFLRMNGSVSAWDSFADFSYRNRRTKSACTLSTERTSGIRCRCDEHEKAACNCRVFDTYRNIQRGNRATFGRAPCLHGGIQPLRLSETPVLTFASGTVYLRVPSLGRACWPNH